MIKEVLSKDIDPPHYKYENDPFLHEYCHHGHDRRNLRPRVKKNL